MENRLGHSETGSGPKPKGRVTGLSRESQLPRISSGVEISALGKVPEERRPLLDPIDTAGRAGDASHHTGYSALGSEVLRDSTDTAAGAEDVLLPKDFSERMVDAFLMFMSKSSCSTCGEQTPPTPDAPPNPAASAPPEHIIVVEPEHLPLPSLVQDVPRAKGKRLVPPATTSDLPATSRGDRPLKRGSTTESDLGFSEQRSWDRLERGLRLKMKEEICRRIPEILYRVTTFLILDNRLQKIMSELKFTMGREHNKNLSPEESAAMEAVLDIQEKMSKKMIEIKQEDGYKQRESLRESLRKIQYELEKKEKTLRMMQGTTPTREGSSIDGRVASSSIRSSLKGPSIDSRGASSSGLGSNSARLGETQAKLEKDIPELRNIIANFQTQLETFETIPQRLRLLELQHEALGSEHDGLKLKVREFKNAFNAEVEEAFNRENKKLKMEQESAKAKMLHLAENLKRQIKSTDEEQYDKYLARRLGILGEKLVVEERVVVEFQTRNPLDMSPEEDMAAFHLGEFIAFAAALENRETSLKDSGGSFEDTHKQKLIKALRTTASSLEKALPLPSEDGRTLEIAQKIWQEQPLTPDDRQALETTLVHAYVRQLSLKTEVTQVTQTQAELQTLETTLTKIRLGEPLSLDDKEALDGALMRSLERPATSDQGVFEMDNP